MPKTVLNLTGEPIELALTVKGVATTTVIYAGKVTLPEYAEVGDVPNGLRVVEAESPIVVEQPAKVESSDNNPPVDDSEEQPLVTTKKK